MTKWTPHFNKVHKQAYPGLCQLLSMNYLHFDVQMSSGRSLQFLEARKHGLPYGFFVGGVGPNDVFFLFPWLYRFGSQAGSLAEFMRFPGAASPAIVRRWLLVMLFSSFLLW